MRDFITIGMVLSLAFVVPLVLNRFSDTWVRPEVAELPTQDADDDDLEDPDSTDDWPSIIEVGCLDSNPDDCFGKEAINEAVATREFAASR
jgi:hypothetical protein